MDSLKQYDAADDARGQHPVLGEYLNMIPGAAHRDQAAREEYLEKLRALQYEFKDKAGNLKDVVYRYNERRLQLIDEVLERAGLRYCQGCRQLRPAVIIELTGVEKRVRVSDSDCSYKVSTWVEKRLEVKYLCYSCREDENWEQETEEHGTLFSTTFSAKLQGEQVHVLWGLDWQPATELFEENSLKLKYTEEIPQRLLNDLGVPYKMKTDVILGGSAIAVSLVDEIHNTIRLFEAPWGVI